MVKTGSTQRLLDPGHPAQERNKPIISGPNGIENKDLIFKCCEVLEKNNLKLLRGQIYKPLTFPYRSKKYYEVGDKGLRILEDIKNPLT